MNRKLHNTFFAFSATGLMLVGGLIAANPVMREHSSAPVRIVEAGPFSIEIEGAREQTALAREAAIEAKAAAYEAKLEQAASTAEILEHTADFTVDIVADAIVAEAFADEAAAESKPQTNRKQRRSHQRAREALALPYFSFAQGLRRSNRS